MEFGKENAKPENTSTSTNSNSSRHNSFTNNSSNSTHSDKEASPDLIKEIKTKMTTINTNPSTAEPSAASVKPPPCDTLPSNAYTERGYKSGPAISAGAFGTIKEITKAGKRYASKEMRRNHLQKQKLDYQILVERHYLKELAECPLIINIIDEFCWYDLSITILEYADKGDLNLLISKYGQFDYVLTKYMTQQLITAVNYLHTRGIVHRDIKPPNILIMNDWNIKLCDFMTACQPGQAAGGEGPTDKKFPNSSNTDTTTSSNSSNTPNTANIDKQSDNNNNTNNFQKESLRKKFVGTKIYMSPEIARSITARGILARRTTNQYTDNQKQENQPSNHPTTSTTTNIEPEISTAIDNWAVGCVIYYMLIGQAPFTTEHRLPPPLTQQKQQASQQLPTSATPVIKLSTTSSDHHHHHHHRHNHPEKITSTNTSKSRDAYESFPQLRFVDRFQYTQNNFEAYITKDLNLPLPSNFTREVLEVLNALLHPLLAKRPALTDLLDYTMFNNVEKWDADYILKTFACPVEHIKPFIPEFKTRPPRTRPWGAEDVKKAREHTEIEKQLENTRPYGGSNTSGSHESGDFTYGSGQQPIACPKQTSNRTSSSSSQALHAWGPGSPGSPPNIHVPFYPPAPPLETIQQQASEEMVEMARKLRLNPVSSMIRSTNKSVMDFDNPESDLGLRFWDDTQMQPLYKKVQQQKSDSWGTWDQVLGEDEIIVKMGVFKKRRGYYSIKTRMFLLTYSPSEKSENNKRGLRFAYYDMDKFRKYGYDKNHPVSKQCYKGEVPMTDKITINALPNFKNLVIETPGRVYYLLDLKSSAKHWKDKLDTVMKRLWDTYEY